MFFDLSHLLFTNLNLFFKPPCILFYNFYIILHYFCLKSFPFFHKQTTCIVLDFLFCLVSTRKTTTLKMWHVCKNLGLSQKFFFLIPSRFQGNVRSASAARNLHSVKLASCLSPQFHGFRCHRTIPLFIFYLLYI